MFNERCLNEKDLLTRALTEHGAVGRAHRVPKNPFIFWRGGDATHLGEQAAFSADGTHTWQTTTSHLRSFGGGCRKNRVMTCRF